MDVKSRSPHRLLITSIIVIALVAIVAGVLWALNMSQQPQTAAPPASTTTQYDSKDTSDKQPAVSARQAKVAYIAIGDGSQTVETIGCGDSVVLIDKTVQATNSAEGALRTLLADKTERSQESGLYNSLWQSTLTVDSVTVSGATADVRLSGQMQQSGECDSPRVKAQLESTAKASSDATTVNVFINGKTLDEALSLK